MIFATENLLLLYDYCKRVLMHVYTYKSYVSHLALSLAQVLSHVSTDEDVCDLPYAARPAH